MGVFSHTGDGFDAALARPAFKATICKFGSNGSSPGDFVSEGATDEGEEGGVKVALLGQVYRGGLSTLMDSYRQGGALAVSGLEGSFLVLIHDKQRGETSLITDHVGSRAGYVWERGNQTHVTNRLSDGPRETALDPGGICSYLASDGIRAGLTPYEGVRAVGPATITSLHSPGLPSSRYWRIPVEPESFDVDDLSGRMLTLMRDAVAKRLGSKPETVLLSLSGGADSKGLLGLLLEQVNSEQIQSFTYFYGEQVGDMDLPEASRAAAAAGVAHRSIEGYRGDFLVTLIDNALRGDAAAHYCDDADVWRSLVDYVPGGAILVTGDRQAHYSSKLPFGLSADSMLRLVSMFPPDSVGWFLERLPGPTGRAMHDQWQSRFEEVAHEYEALGSWQETSHPAYIEQRVAYTLALWRELFCSQVGTVANPFLDRALLEFVGRLPMHFNDVDGEFLHRLVLEEAFPALFAGKAAHGGWNIPDWGSEMARNAPALRDLVLGVDSPLEQLVPKGVTIDLLDELVQRGPQLQTATMGWRWQLRKAVKHSQTLTDIIRRTKMRRRVTGSPVEASRAAVLRRLLTLHLALADPTLVKEQYEKVRPI